MKAGKFITIEGGEGVGKTTNLSYITQVLAQHNIDYIVTREPGGTPFAESIRTILLSPHDEKVGEMTELLLIFAARAQHLSQVILPALSAGKWVVCDRFTDATYAYQGGGRGLSTHTIAQLESMVQGSLRPDLTLILDLDPEIGLERARKRAALDRFELEKLAFFKRIRDTYRLRAEAEPDRCALIDAGQALELVQQAIHKQLGRLL